MEFQRSVRRRRFSAQERSRLLGLYRASGLTQARFAQQQGIHLSTLQQWLYRPAPKRVGKIPARFHELPVSSLLPPSWLAEIALDCGTTLRLTGAANPDWISSVLNALRQKPC